jgi:hypothetical protein
MQLSTLTTVIIVTVGVTLAQNSTINPDVQTIGCPEFGCPNVTGDTSRDWDLASCRVVQDNLGAVGIAENIFDVPGTNGTRLSLTMARTLHGSSRYDWAMPIDSEFGMCKLDLSPSISSLGITSYLKKEHQN